MSGFAGEHKVHRGLGPDEPRQTLRALAAWKEPDVHLPPHAQSARTTCTRAQLHAHARSPFARRSARWQCTGSTLKHERMCMFIHVHTYIHMHIHV